MERYIVLLWSCPLPANGWTVLCFKLRPIIQVLVLYLPNLNKEYSLDFELAMFRLAAMILWSSSAKHIRKSAPAQFFHYITKSLYKGTIQNKYKQQEMPFIKLPTSQSFLFLRHDKPFRTKTIFIQLKHNNPCYKRGQRYERTCSGSLDPFCEF